MTKEDITPFKLDDKDFLKIVNQEGIKLMNALHKYLLGVSTFVDNADAWHYYRDLHDPSVDAVDRENGMKFLIDFFGKNYGNMQNTVRAAKEARIILEDFYVELIGFINRYEEKD